MFSSHQAVVDGLVLEDSVHGVAARLEQVIVNLHARQDLVDARLLKYLNFSLQVGTFSFILIRARSFKENSLWDYANYGQFK